jgi:hypothetical protein
MIKLTPEALMDAQQSSNEEPETQSRKASERTRARRRKSQQLAALGYPAPKTSDAYRGRQLLNADTIREMHIAFREGGAEAIRKVMKNQPAIFLKLLVLLVPRELQIEHRGGVKGMTEEQIIDAIEAIEGYLARRSGEAAKVIEGTTTSSIDTPIIEPAGAKPLK